MGSQLAWLFREYGLLSIMLVVFALAAAVLGTILVCRKHLWSERREGGEKQF